MTTSTPTMTITSTPTVLMTLPANIIAIRTGTSPRFIRTHITPTFTIGTGTEWRSDDGWSYLPILSDTDQISRGEPQPSS